MMPVDSVYRPACCNGTLTRSPVPVAVRPYRAAAMPAARNRETLKSPSPLVGMSGASPRFTVVPNMPPRAM